MSIITCPYCGNGISDLSSAQDVDYPSSGSAFVIPSGTAIQDLANGVFSGSALSFVNVTCPFCGRNIGLDGRDF
jgi:hypothetical protein